MDISRICTARVHFSYEDRRCRVESAQCGVNGIRTGRVTGSSVYKKEMSRGGTERGEPAGATSMPIQQYLVVLKESLTDRLTGSTQSIENDSAPTFRFTTRGTKSERAHAPVPETRRQLRESWTTIADRNERDNRICCIKEEECGGEDVHI